MDLNLCHFQGSETAILQGHICLPVLLLLEAGPWWPYLTTFLLWRFKGLSVLWSPGPFCIHTSTVDAGQLLTLPRLLAEFLLTRLQMQHEALWQKS